MPDTASIMLSHLTSALHEARVFPPPKAFSTHAHISSLASYRKLYRESIAHPDTFCTLPMLSSSCARQTDFAPIAEHLFLRSTIQSSHFSKITQR